MKHNLKITAILILIFILSQIIGLNIISQYIDINSSAETGTTVLNKEKYLIQPPEIKNESTSWIYILTGVLTGTGLILLIIKYKLNSLWKIWFSLGVFIALLVAIFPYIAIIFKKSGLPISIILVAFMTYSKIWKKNLIMHNIVEILLYGGIAALLVPVINTFSAIILLVLISIYDAYAVWKSKHMVKMAEFQMEENLFAGINIPYKLPKKQKSNTQIKTTKKKIQTAILGGGDIAFPLLFAGAILKQTASFPIAISISLGATAGLSLLFIISQKGKFYPAMPFISAGCFLVYTIQILL